VADTEAKSNHNKMKNNQGEEAGRKRIRENNPQVTPDSDRP
jgi:hypothetical protein